MRIDKDKPVMTVDVQMHIDRVASRVEQGGHWIAEEDIRWRYGQLVAEYRVCGIVDQLIINDITYEPVIVAEIQQNRMIHKINQVPNWSKSVLDLF